MKFTNPRDPENKEMTKTIKRWIMVHGKYPEETAIWVSEVNCVDPGCPDMETVMLVMPGKDEKHSFRVRKPMVFVREADIIKALKPE